MSRMTSWSRLLLAGCAGIGLAACGTEPDTTTTQVDATTTDGSQLIVEEQPAGSVPVRVPDAPVRVTTETQAAIAATPQPAPAATATPTPAP